MLPWSYNCQIAGKKDKKTPQGYFKAATTMTRAMQFTVHPLLSSAGSISLWWSQSWAEGNHKHRWNLPSFLAGVEICC